MFNRLNSNIDEDNGNDYRIPSLPSSSSPSLCFSLSHSTFSDHPSSLHQRCHPDSPLSHSILFIPFSHHHFILHPHSHHFSLPAFFRPFLPFCTPSVHFPFHFHFSSLLSTSCSSLRAHRLSVAVAVRLTVSSTRVVVTSGIRTRMGTIINLTSRILPMLIMAIRISTAVTTPSPTHRQRSVCPIGGVVRETVGNIHKWQTIIVSLVRA